MKTFWNEDHPKQELVSKYQDLVPVMGKADNPMIDIFRIMVNLYYDFYNNGACNWDNYVRSGEAKQMLEFSLTNKITSVSSLIQMLHEELDEHTCEECAGAGEVDNCWECGGAGSYDCECAGEDEDCPEDCDDGFMNCSNCDDGWVSCDECDGYGTVGGGYLNFSDYTENKYNKAVSDILDWLEENYND